MITNNSDMSHLFTVRIWSEKLGEEMTEMRFQVKHVTSGECRLFRDGEQLLAYLHSKIEEVEGNTVDPIALENKGD